MAVVDNGLNLAAAMFTSGGGDFAGSVDSIQVFSISPIASKKF